MKKLLYYFQMIIIVSMMIGFPLMLINIDFAWVFMLGFVILGVIQISSSLVLFFQIHNPRFKNTIKTYWLLVSGSIYAIITGLYFYNYSIYLGIALLLIGEVYYLIMYKRLSFYTRNKALW